MIGDQCYFAKVPTSGPRIAIAWDRLVFLLISLDLFPGEKQCQIYSQDKLEITLQTFFVKVDCPVASRRTLANTFLQEAAVG